MSSLILTWLLTSVTSTERKKMDLQHYRNKEVYIFLKALLTTIFLPSSALPLPLLFFFFLFLLQLHPHQSLAQPPSVFQGKAKTIEEGLPSRNREMSVNTGTHSFLTNMAGFLTDIPASMLSLTLTNTKEQLFPINPDAEARGGQVFLLYVVKL